MAEPLTHYFHDVPGWFDWPDLYVLLIDRTPVGGHIVEVGGWKGQSAAFMGVELSVANKDIRFDVVDTWEGTPSEPDHAIDPDVQAGRLYDVFLANTAPVRQYVRPIRSTSVQAASTYADASLDAVFLDGDHETDALLADLQAWWPKVKPGGILAGHDRNWASVQRAVHAFGQFAGVRVRPVSASSWQFDKPAQVTDWTVPEGERSLLVAICSNERSIYRQTAMSLLDVISQIPGACAEHGFGEYAHLWVDKYPSVAAMRDYALLKAEQIKASHVLFLDADMTWPDGMPSRMLRHHSVGMVSGVYHLKSWPYWPVLLERPFINNKPRKAKQVDGTVDDLPPSYAVEYHYIASSTLNESELQPMADGAIGMGCALVPMAAPRAFKRPWFEYMPDNVGLPSVTEDMAFCARSRAVGCPIWFDPTVKCGHIGQETIKQAWFQRATVEMEIMRDLREKGEHVGGMDALNAPVMPGSAA